MSFADALTEWNGQAANQGSFTITVLEGDYTVNGLEIKQIKGNTLKIISEEGKTVKISGGASGNVFVINGQSSFDGGAITFENLTFDLVGGKKAVVAGNTQNTRYAHDLTVKSCTFINSAAAGTRAGYIFGADSGSCPRHFVVDGCTANNINQVGSGYFYSDPIDTVNPGITIKDTTLTGCKAVLNNQGAGSYSYLKNVTATDCFNPLLIQISGGANPAKIDVIDSKLGSVASTDNDKNKVGIITARYSDCVINISNTTFTHPNCTTLTDVWAYDRANGSAGGYGDSKNSTSVQVTVNRIDNGLSVVLNGKTSSSTYRKAAGQEEGYGEGTNVADIRAVAKIGTKEYQTLAAALVEVQTGDTVEILVEEIALANLKGGVNYIGLVDDNGKPATKVTSISGTFTSSTIKNFDLACEVGWSTGNDTVIDNCKFSNYSANSGSEDGNALRYCYVGKGHTFTIKNCEFAQSGRYGIHFDGADGTVIVQDSKITGSVAVAESLENITFENCDFAGRSTTTGHCNINIYNDATFNNCTFAQCYTTGSSRGILMLNDDNKSHVRLNNCSVEAGTGTLFDLFRQDWSQGVGSINASQNASGKYLNGYLVSCKGASDLELGNGVSAAKIAEASTPGDAGTQKIYLVGISAANDSNNKITAGKFAVNPIAYIASGYTVQASGDQKYPYEVVAVQGEEPKQTQVVVEQTTEVTISDDISNPEEARAAQQAIEDSNVSGVADSLTETGKSQIIQQAIDDSSPITNKVIDDAKMIDISVTVKAEVTVSKSVEVVVESEKMLVVELNPYAIVTATDKDGNQIQSDLIKVDNEFLADKSISSIMVVLGCDFEPAQVLHIKKDGTVEKFDKGTEASYENRTFTYKDKMVTLEITEFSEVKMLAKEVYRNISFDANGGTGSMDTVSWEAGKEYTLPDNGFTAPADSVFAGWKIGDKVYQPGDVYQVPDQDVVAVAQWKASDPEPKSDPDPDPGQKPVPGTGDTTPFAGGIAVIMIAIAELVIARRRLA